MSQKAQQFMETVGWGWIASLILHLLLVVFLFVRLPDLSAPAAEQSVNVELVPPQPEPKPEPAPTPAPTPKPQPKEAEPASAQQPQAFESATQEKQPEQPKTNEVPTESTDESQSTEGSDTEAAAKNDPASGQEAKSDEKNTEEPPSPTQESAHLDGAFPAVDNPPVPADKPTPAKADAAAKESGQQSSANQTAKKLKKAQRIYSADALSDPHVKQALGKLAPSQRVRQVCGIEALEQIRHQQPGTVPVSLAGPRVPDSATEFNLIGGAFLSRDQWYELDIKCQVDANSIAIKSFSFHIGGAIPKSEWSKRELR